MQMTCTPESSEVERLGAALDARGQRHLFAVSERLRVDGAPRDRLARQHLAHSHVRLQPLVGTLDQLPVSHQLHLRQPRPTLSADSNRHESFKAKFHYAIQVRSWSHTCRRRASSLLAS